MITKQTGLYWKQFGGEASKEKHQRGLKPKQGAKHSSPGG